jgi:hypothetical protein
MRYSTGCVSIYVANGCGGPDLPQSVPEGAAFRDWYNLAGHQVSSSWDNGNVWGSDFREGPNNDLAPDGGSDIPDIYYYSGHGTCQNPPAATSSEFINVCGDFGDPDSTTIGTQCRWGSLGGNVGARGNLKFLFLDASCPMDLVSIQNSWFPVFQGLHMAVGHSGTTTSDTLDSVTRGSQFAAYTAGLPPPLNFFFPQLSIGDAWMITGVIDIQSGCCAVALAAGNDRNDAIDRRENERVTDNRGDPSPNWFAWKWVCA